jgi:hypothetical protein
MVDLEDRLKRALEAAIQELNPNTFAAREAVYDRARQMLINSGVTVQELHLLQRVTIEIESEIVILFRHHIERLGRFAQRIALIGPLIIGFVYIPVQFSGIPFYKFFDVVDPGYILSIALSLYFLVVGLGFKFDIDTQRQILLLDPNQGHPTRDAIAGISFYLVTAVALFWSSQWHSFKWFALTLTIWHFSGILFWKLLANQISGILRESQDSATFRKDYYAVERLDLVRRYVRGKWHRPRHILLSCLVLAFDFLVIPNAGAHFIAQTWVPDSLQIQVYVFVVYATIGEGWTWLQRFTMLCTIRVLDRLEGQFVLVRRPLRAPDEEAPAGLW